MRNPDSHKGENGKVAVIGGSKNIHGAPIFSALAAEASGVDLTFVSLPATHDIIARIASLNFLVYPFHGEELTKKDVGPILQMLAIMDAAVIGPGLGRSEEVMNAIEQIVSGAPCPLVLDATALQPNSLALVAGKNAVLTPHLGELERMEVQQDDIGASAARSNCVILLKGHVDHIAGPDGNVTDVEGGNAGLTVGGTGDALAGLTAGLIAQHMDPFNAAVLASKTIKAAGDRLAEEKGMTYTTKDVIEQIPYLLREMEA
jgi:NAD(P)H-hydrate epimerase